jgi:hypothetical protein
VQADVDRVLRIVRDALSPRVLREKIVLSFGQWREEFAPRAMQPASQEELVADLVRFVGHLNQRRYASALREPWPEVHARRDLRDLLARRYGSSIGGETALWRLAQEQSVRTVLDTVARLVQEERLAAYLDLDVVHPIRLLSQEDQYLFAQAYLAQFRALAHIETKHPAILMLHWHEVFDTHARLVLGW